jgi:hypothetical protein
MHAFLKIPRPVDIPGPLESEFPIIPVLSVGSSSRGRYNLISLFADIKVLLALLRAPLLQRYRVILQVRIRAFIY